MIKHTIEEMQNIAISRNGECLSSVYINFKSHLKWRCNKCGYIWKTSSDCILRGYWCPKCKNLIKKSLQDAHNIAHKHNGVCLSTSFKNIRTKLRWKCNICNTIWNASYHSIDRGTWCPSCARERQIKKVAGKSRNGKIYTIDVLREIAINKGGTCLSNEYVNMNTKYRWKCSSNHEWNASFDNIKRGKWCPFCANLSLINEQYCKYIFESIFERNFQKAYPKWLKSIKNRQMELDGYNEELQVAFEYNGIHHYKKGYKTLNRTLNDQLKKKLCNDHKILLIVIPYTIKLQEIQKIVVNIYYKHTGVKLPLKNINLENSEMNSNHRERLYLKYKDIIEAKGGRMLSEKYIDHKTKLKVQCKHGHAWNITPNQIKHRNCPYCSKHRRTDG